MASRVKARRKRSSGCSVLMPFGLAPYAGTFESRFRHLAEVKDLVQLPLVHAPTSRQLADRASRADRFLGELAGLVVADHRVQRGRQHRTSLDQLRPAVGRLQAFDAALGEIARRG